VKTLASVEELIAAPKLLLKIDQGLRLRFKLHAWSQLWKSMIDYLKIRSLTQHTPGYIISMMNSSTIQLTFDSIQSSLPRFLWTEFTKSGLYQNLAGVGDVHAKLLDLHTRKISHGMSLIELG
jgi:hypothetical protein